MLYRVTRPLPRAVTPIVLTLALVLATVWAVLGAAPAVAVEDVTPARVGGGERTETAAEIALLTHPGGTDQAVVATAVEAQDALAAASLAGATGAAMLLVNPDAVPAATASALVELGVTAVTLVGDQTDISEEVRAELDADYDVVRIAGADQYETAAEVAGQTIDIAGTVQVDGLRTVLLANGENFPDALSGSPAAYAGPIPVLYTEPGTLREEVTTFLDQRDIQQVVILGGTLAVSAEVQTEIESTGRTVVRLGGRDRVETSLAVADWTETVLGFTTSTVVLARGDDFPDALTSGQLAGSLAVPLVLSATPEVLPAPAAQYFADNCDTIEVVQAVGGEAAITTALLEEAEVAAEQCQTGGGDPGGDAAVADFVMTPLELRTDVQVVDTIAATDLDGIDTLDVALFSCTDVAVDVDGSALFDDIDADGFADGFGDTAASLVTGINNVDVDNARVVPQVSPEGDRLGVQVSAFDDDCAVVVVLEAQPASDSGLPVNADGRPTIPYGVATVVFGDPPTDPSTDSHVYAVDPMEPLSGIIGQSEQFTVSGRFDGGPVDVPLDIVLFPCDETDVLGTGDDVFNDSDNDGGADGFATTETGALMITAINGQEIEPTQIVSAPPVDGQIAVTVHSDAVDCATAVAVDGNGNGKFDVDADGVPTEPYGVAQISYS